MATIVDRLIVNIEAKTEKFGASIRKMQGDMLGVGLTLLFTGMAIKRFFQGILTTLFQNFLMIEGESGVVNDAVGELLAALAFLGFSLVDAFRETGMIDLWIERIMTLINWFNGLSNNAKAILLNIAVWATIAATAMMVLGQGILFANGAISGMVLLWKGLKGLALIPFFGKLGRSISALAKFAILGGLVFAIFMVIAVIFELVKRMGGLLNFSKAVVAGIAKAFSLLTDFLVGGILTVLELLVAAAAKLARIVRLKKIAGALEDAAFAIDKARVRQRGISVEKLEQIDVATGAAGIRRTFEQNNQINIEGSVEQDTIDKMINALNERLGFFSGSPQT